MTNHLRREDGSALISAIIMVLILTVMGLALMNLGDTQETAATKERARESSLGITESALTAQIQRLSKNWPGGSTAAYPTCTPTTGSVTYCPDGTALASSFNSVDNNNTRCASPTDWQTTVRDNGSTIGSYYVTSVAATQPAYDANGDGLVWVRSDGRARCRLRSVVTLVRAGLVSMSFPYFTVSANWLQITNSGRKTIIDTTGKLAVGTNPAAHPAPVAVRCQGTLPAGVTSCLQSPASKQQIQISGSSPQLNSTMQTPVLTDDQDAMLKAYAKSLGTYYSTPGCPASVTGKLVYVEDMGSTPCTIHGGNSAASPGVLVFEKGSIYIGANDIFYGLIYGRNKQGTNGTVVDLGGTADIQGAIAVDGLGGVRAGASGANIVFDSRALSMVQGFGTASPVPGTWRELSPGE